MRQSATDGAPQSCYSRCSEQLIASPLPFESSEQLRVIYSYLLYELSKLSELPTEQQIVNPPTSSVLYRTADCQSAYICCWESSEQFQIIFTEQPIANHWFILTHANFQNSCDGGLCCKRSFRDPTVRDLFGVHKGNNKSRRKNWIQFIATEFNCRYKSYSHSVIIPFDLINRYEHNILDD